MIEPDRECSGERWSVADEVFQSILRGIIRGDLPRGGRIDTRATATTLGVSTTPVRQALARLGQLGLVEVHARLATRVADWQPSQIGQRLDVVGRVVNVLLDDPVRDPFEVLRALPQGSIASGPATALLDVVESIARRATNRIAAHIVNEHILPLRVFFEPGVAEAHGVDTGRITSDLAGVFATLVDALVANERTAATAAMTACTDTLRSVLDGRSRCPSPTRTTTRPTPALRGIAPTGSSRTHA